jgi:hypothetical protein
MHKITVKLQKDMSFIPSNSFDKILIEKELKINNIYAIRITKGRSYHSLGLYWLILKAYSYVRYSDDSYDKYLHSVFKRAYFGVRKIVNPLTKKIEEIEQSISFEKLDEVEFKKYLSFLINKLNENGIDYIEMIKNYREVL